jgi:hypothetical protein
MSGHTADIPSGVTTVTKNAYFTYIKGTGLEHRHAVQVWNVAEQSWTFHIYTGGTYQFAGKPETNCFHKKHLITLSGTDTKADKALSVFNKRTANITQTNTARNTLAGEFVTAIKPGITTGTSKDKTNAAREKQGEIYLQKGYGNKLTATTLTVIDCSAFTSGNAIGQQFAKALVSGATGPATKDQFITGAIWHPTVDFETPCVYQCPNGVVNSNPTDVMRKARVWVHLLSVDGGNKDVVCQVYHLEMGVL